jgi:hypothetical protein
MCAETVTFEESKFINRAIAPLSRETMKKLPRVVVNGILGNAAVHMASRQPGNATLERRALETKVKVFQSFNGLLQNSHDQQPDVIITASALVFAMDVWRSCNRRCGTVLTNDSFSNTARVGGWSTSSDRSRL